MQFSQTFIKRFFPKALCGTNSPMNEFNSAIGGCAPL